MDFPVQFFEMCWKLSQEAEFPPFESESEFTDYLLAGFTSDDLETLSNYMSGLLRKGLTDKELERVCHKAGSDLRILDMADGDMMIFLGMILNAIDTKRRATP
jgi:hypothetical protein